MTTSQAEERESILSNGIDDSCPADTRHVKGFHGRSGIFIATGHSPPDQFCRSRLPEFPPAGTGASADQAVQQVRTGNATAFDSMTCGIIATACRLVADGFLFPPDAPD
jgi:hypothetical protein